MKKRVEFVNPFIGTAGSGHALVGPLHPHGMVKLGPDTISLPCGGYDYTDGKILGFSHTHLEGVGGSGGRGNIMLSASVGDLKVEEKEFASVYSHEDESARVGYYQVRLLDYDINVELSATKHCGFHRYTFPKTKDAHILVDVGHTLGKSFNLCFDGEIEALNDHSFRGWGSYPLTRDREKRNVMKIYFYGETSQPFESFQLWSGREILENSDKVSGSKVGLAMNYQFAEPSAVEVKVGLSFVSGDQAKINLEKEIPAFDFNRCVQDCGDAWEAVLSRVQIQGNSKDSQIQLYSALYRAMNQPTDYQEYDWYFDGVGQKDNNVYPSEGHGFYSDDWAIWDTFRTTHPLQNLLEPERTADQALALLRMYDHGGWLPMCTGPALGYNQTMIGHNASSVLLDAVVNGAEGIDLEKTYEAMEKQALQEHPERRLRMLGVNKEYAEKGYLPYDSGFESNFSVSESLEYIYGDWCTAQMAKRLGKKKEYELFSKRAQNYKNLFDGTVGFMRPRLRDGSFVKDFSPTTAFKEGFCETSSWEYSFFVPHDVQGLINLVGGNQEFTDRLDEFFDRRLYNNQNETGIQTPFLYNYAGKPWKTQKTTLFYVRNFHFNKPGGLYGEDDAGAMSAWYAFASLGLFPVCPGQGIFTITSPNFESVALQLGQKEFRIRCVNFSLENQYIQGALLNQKPFDKTYLTLDQLKEGGELVLFMGNTESDWGTKPESAPPSMTEQPISVSLESAVIKEAEATGRFQLEVRVKNLGPDCTWIAQPTAGENAVGKMRIPLQSGETKTVAISCKAFCRGENTIVLEDTVCGTVVVSQGESVKLEVLDKLTVDRIYCHRDHLQPVTVTATVQNTGLDACDEMVPLLVNDQPYSAVRCKLPSGSSTRLSFTFIPSGDCAQYSFKVLNAPAAGFDVTGPLDYKFHTYAMINDAEYSQCGSHIYMKVRGFQSVVESAFLYHKYGIQGDFEACVCVGYEENTNPYSPTGIVVSNHIGGDLKGSLFLGAGSQRGFLFDWFGQESNVQYPSRGYLGAPAAPYWFKIVKRGKTFCGYYSMNGKEWNLMNQVTLEDANEVQMVGIFANSGSPDQRLIQFKDFTIRKIYD